MTMTPITTDRGMMGMPGMGAMNTPMVGTMMPMPAMMSPQQMMLPRCTIKMEKMPNGMKATCMCSDKASAMMMQNLCNMMPNAMLGCCCMCNGMMVCQCCMPMGMCKVEMMEMGCNMMCLSADPMACKMMHACCDCMMSMMMPGCTVMMTLNGMPVCCCVC